MSEVLFASSTWAGSIKFNPEVTAQVLCEIVEDWKKIWPDLWIDIHVRPARDDSRHYIGLCARLEDGSKSTGIEFHEKIFGYLDTKFGRDVKHNRPYGVKGWSISPVLCGGPEVP